MVDIMPVTLKAQTYVSEMLEYKEHNIKKKKKTESVLQNANAVQKKNDCVGKDYS